MFDHKQKLYRDNVSQEMCPTLSESDLGGFKSLNHFTCLKGLYQGFHSLKNYPKTVKLCQIIVWSRGLTRNFRNVFEIWIDAGYVWHSVVWNSHLSLFLSTAILQASTGIHGQKHYRLLVSLFYQLVASCQRVTTNLSMSLSSTNLLKSGLLKLFIYRLAITCWNNL